MSTWIISGSRHCTDYEAVAPWLSQMMEVQGEAPSLIVHGGAPGVDSWASRWAYENKVDLEIMGAKWGTYGSAAGPRRNLEILNRHGSPSCTVICFPSPSSRGTRHMIDHAERRKYDLKIFRVRA